MERSKTSNRYSPQMRVRAVRMVLEHQGSYATQSAAVAAIAPSTYYACLAVRADPAKASARQQTDLTVRPKIKKVWDDNGQVYGVRKAWRQLCREGEAAAGCPVARAMASMGLRGVVRGKALKTTIPDASMPCPRDKVNRVFRAPAPNMLSVSDWTYVSTWQGFVDVAPRHWARTKGAFNGSMIDTFANRTVGWKVVSGVPNRFRARRS